MNEKKSCLNCVFSDYVKNYDKDEILLCRMDTDFEAIDEPEEKADLCVYYEQAEVMK